ncbi:hypothetical protein BDN70DRAFT_480402 [Pholiota conissans]|uniref:Secreted protein n=1 Tax=Pholiota conissans TaxID=109636 RepID=A0A9P5Z5N8_9AGAR|nr:hypothetical protein BDN70DRAFT_480402 [Pholiota conissans]
MLQSTQSTLNLLLLLRTPNAALSTFYPTSPPSRFARRFSASALQNASPLESCSRQTPRIAASTPLHLYAYVSTLQSFLFTPPQFTLNAYCRCVSTYTGHIVIS